MLIGAGAVLLVGAIAVRLGSNRRQSVEQTALLQRPNSLAITSRISHLGAKRWNDQAPWELGHSSVLVFSASYCVPCQEKCPRLQSTFALTAQPRRGPRR